MDEGVKDLYLVFGYWKVLRKRKNGKKNYYDTKENEI